MEGGWWRIPWDFSGDKCFEVAPLTSGDASGAGFSEATKFDLNSQAFLGIAMPMEPLGWTVVVAQPIHQMFGPIQSMFLTVATALVLSFVLALLATWIQARKSHGPFSVGTPSRPSPWPRVGTIWSFRRPTSRSSFVFGENLHQMALTISQRERQLVASENNLRIILDSIGEAVIATDTDGVVTRLNPSAETLTGWSAEEALGKPLTDVCRILDARTLEPAPNPAIQVLDRERTSGKFRSRPCSSPGMAGNSGSSKAELRFNGPTDTSSAWVPGVSGHH